MPPLSPQGRIVVLSILIFGVVLVCGLAGAGALLVFKARLARESEQVAREAQAKAAGLGDEGAAKRGRELAKGQTDGKADARPPMTKKEFEAAVRGKTKDQIITAVGRPDETRENVPQQSRQTTPDGVGAGPGPTFHFDWWVYRGRVMNEATGRPYAEVRVRIGPAGVADIFEYE
jgi:hypothetical protein